MGVALLESYRELQIPFLTGDEIRCAQWRYWVPHPPVARRQSLP
jgi:hypothetical protein